MQDLIITIAQVNQIWEEKEANLGHFETMLKDIGKTDLILLPEMFHTGFTMNSSEMAENMEDSLALEWLRRMAAEKDAAIYTSFIVGEDEDYFNRGVFVEPSGEIHIYDKRKAFVLAGEHTVFTQGKEQRIVEFRGWRINLQVCYDLRFPENVRNGLREDGSAHYDLLLYVANWPEKRIAHWEALLKARAIENQCFVAGVNRVGLDANDLYYSGESNVYSALGNALLERETSGEYVLNVMLSFSDLQATRTALPFLIPN